MSTRAKWWASICAAIIATASLYTLGHTTAVATFGQWPYAPKSLEIIVAGLQLQNTRSELRETDEKIFKIRYEMQRNPRSRFLQDELRKSEERKKWLEMELQRQIQMEQRR